MRVFFRATVVVLLGVVLISPLATQGLVTSAGPPLPVRPAGCHEDSGQPPARGPVSHQCCQVSHHPAILQQLSRLQLALEVSTLSDFPQNIVQEMAPGRLPSLLIVSGDPPALPLRI